MLTLREGLQDYYDANPHLLDASQFQNQTGAFFRSHDRIHVVFGCDTSFVDEARTDLWTLLGTDLGIRYFKFLASPLIRDIYQDFKKKITDEDKKRLAHDVREGWVQALLAPLHIYRRTRHMKQRWPWAENDAFLDQPLKEIRQDFGIEIF